MALTLLLVSKGKNDFMWAPTESFSYSMRKISCTFAIAVCVSCDAQALLSENFRVHRVDDHDRILLRRDASHRPYGAQLLKLGSNGIALFGFPYLEQFIEKSTEMHDRLA